MAPKDIHDLIPGTCKCYKAKKGGVEFTVVIKVRNSK